MITTNIFLDFLFRNVPAHRLGPAPLQRLPDRSLSERVRPLLIRFEKSKLANPVRHPARLLFRASDGLRRLCAGCSRTSRSMESARPMTAPLPAPAPPEIRGGVHLARFIAAQPALLEALRAVAALGLPDAWIGAGFVRNAVWDALHGFPVGANPPSDVDLVWFDPARASAAGDAAVEARLRQGPPRGIPWQARNQARMAARNGDAPYAGTLDAMACWPETATVVAARLDAAGSVEVAAPWGVADLLAGVVRPTPAFASEPAKREAFERRIAAKGWLRRWPELCVFRDPPQ